MSEINEAAKIIVESIDPEAKVIFGAVVDDKLKKGEIKITVIATGFDEVMKRMGEPKIQDISPINQAEEKARKRVEFKTKEPEKTENEWDIPAFIRRKMQ